MNNTVKKATLIGLKKMIKTDLMELNAYAEQMPDYNIDAFFVQQAVKVSNNLCATAQHICELVQQIKKTYEE